MVQVRRGRTRSDQNSRLSISRVVPRGGGTQHHQRPAGEVVGVRGQQVVAAAHGEVVEAPSPGPSTWRGLRLPRRRRATGWSRPHVGGLPSAQGLGQGHRLGAARGSGSRSGRQCEAVVGARGVDALHLRWAARTAGPSAGSRRAAGGPSCRTHGHARLRTHWNSSITTVHTPVKNPGRKWPSRMSAMAGSGVDLEGLRLAGSASGLPAARTRSSQPAPSQQVGIAPRRRARVECRSPRAARTAAGSRRC